MIRLVRAVDRVIGMLCLIGTGIAAILLLASLALVFYSVFMRYFALAAVHDDGAVIRLSGSGSR